jgi:hypothetical protein
MPHAALVEFRSFADLPFSQPACHSERSRERCERKSKNPFHYRYPNHDHILISLRLHVGHRSLALANRRSADLQRQKAVDFQQEKTLAKA